MPKVKISDSQGILQEPGSGVQIVSLLTSVGSMNTKGAFYSGVGTTTALATGSFPLLSSAPVQTVDSANNAHGVRLPDAAAAGEIMIIRNVDSAQDVVIRNSTETGAVLLTLGEGKTAIFFSTASGASSWSGSTVD